MSNLLLFNNQERPRPAPVRQPVLPPWDTSNPDGSGIVHVVPPPELVIPSGPDLMFMRADFNGVTLDKTTWPDGIFKDFNILGANSTPYQMLMTPMVVLYPRPVQDAVFTAHCERGHSHFIVAPDGWNLDTNGVIFTPATYVAWCQKVRSWGFYVVHWQPEPDPNHPLLRAALDAGVIDWIVFGEEVDGKVSSQQYTAALTQLVGMTNLPIGAHFTSDYPSGAPRDDYLVDWSPFDGKVHLCWQANQNESAGTQGGRLYYARQRVNLGMVSPDGGVTPGAPHSRVYAFETMATKQLYGQCDELYGKLRSLELLYTTRADARILPMSGYGNGGSLPDGSVL